MPAKLRKTPLEGIVVPMCTPLVGNDQLDREGLQRLTESLLAAGVGGLFLLGSTGEGPSVNDSTKRDLVRRVCQQTAGRVPVLVCVTDAAWGDALSLARHAADCDADAIVFAPPYYFKPSQRDLYEFASQLIDASPLPTVLYNMPGFTHCEFEAETVKRLLDDSQVIGVKDSSGDLDYFEAIAGLVRQRDDCSLFMGPEELLSQAMSLGADGGVCGGGNVQPQLFVDWHRALAEGRLDDAATLQRRVAELGKIYRVPSDATSPFIVGIKTALELSGVCSGMPALPSQRPSRAQREEIASKLVEIGVLQA
ncbi:MAG: dihydrodipicolinate synthase family protein [Planctomycetales bacterium]|nr:dihydrodipicolinate synthase family protein [Planctomycetales bacterium]